MHPDRGPIIHGTVPSRGPKGCCLRWFFGLLRSPSMCYKPDMRKWIRDRVKGRRKPSDKKTESTQAPLQPAYFDAGTPAADAAASEAPVSIPDEIAADETGSPRADGQDGPE